MPRSGQLRLKCTCGRRAAVVGAAEPQCLEAPLGRALNIIEIKNQDPHNTEQIRHLATLMIH